MLGVSDHASLSVVSHNDITDVAFLPFKRRRRSGLTIFGAQYPAYACHCQRFTDILTNVYA